MESTLLFDVNNNEIFVGDIVTYSDIEHSIVSEKGFIRKNLNNKFEVVNDDLQSGNEIVNLNYIEKWQ